MYGYRLLEYLEPDGRSPFSDWLTGLRDIRRAKTMWADYRKRNESNQQELPG